MDSKKMLTNKSFCPLPWSGFELEPNGNVKNCIISKEKLGNINQDSISSIIQSKKNLLLKKDMLADKRFIKH